MDFMNFILFIYVLCNNKNNLKNLITHLILINQMLLESIRVY